ncbi:serine/threonine-protein kinase ULK3-like isoform X2 [Pomacea canaliculata]|uniref:serine/threonine-protein kinase ULK3-like isoform X2 n=1 Tax=Pomacea canaliculata TaxID=400727 RepID=UPI000D72C470|nr:serine/threonine-protein kinase ULK3-like isoform X2 [Pomacea canaliculata]
MASAQQTTSVVPNLANYILTEKLGSGSYATVYKAYKKTGIREVVAIKCVLKSSLNKASTENLLTEIELLKNLKHEHIVELKDFIWDSKYIYLVMEYCSGGDLSHFIKSKRALPERIVRKFLQQIALAMQFLHDNNVVHMDLKPQNILLTASSNPSLKIGDFGFAKPMLEGDQMDVMRGSPLYMAPEIICRKSYDARVDLWSIGVILYECLFGRAPFASRSFKELGEKIWDSKPVELPPGVEVSDDCRDLLLKLLQRNPEDRISFEEFFNHPFVDLLHAPSPYCLRNAKDIVSQAVKKDTEGDYKNAVTLYCNALAFFVPAIHYEKDPVKKEALRAKVREYMMRAETLKQLLKPHKSSESVNTLERTISSDGDEKLASMCGDNSPELQAAMKLIEAATKEVEREEFDKALNHYEIALGAIIKLLPSEPKGPRRDLIVQQVKLWMSKAEEIKAYLAIRELKTEDTSKQEEEEDESQTGIMNLCRLQ